MHHPRTQPVLKIPPSTSPAPMDLTTPALLFPAISLLLLAYTNRFTISAQLIRQLRARYLADAKEMVIRQIANLRMRIMLIRWMQTMGVTSFLLCALTMLLIFVKLDVVAKAAFGVSLFLLVVSLVISLAEIMISTKAIEIEIEDMEQSLDLH
jgi:hypothetical protein